MPFIDWNNNGRLDPVDIGISLAIEDEADDDVAPAPPAHSRQKPAAGCLTTLVASWVILAVTGVLLWTML